MTDTVSDPANLARDPVALTRALIRCPSVTPAEGGALEFLETVLGSLGFTCHRLRFEEPGTEPVENLYARLGTAGPNFAFAGHTDVVPPGKREGWTVDPFAGEVMGGRLFGRGAVDMKGAVAAFVAAAARHLDTVQRENRGAPKGSISLIITGDEEGVAINGTRKVLEWMVANGETVDACVVGEPTNPKTLGDMIKIGRRGSITGHITVFGAQGHVAYPHLADNPLPRLVAMLKALTDDKLDEGTAHFQASTLAITTIDVGNPAHNIIPAQGKATFNVRFNDAHSPESLMKRIRDTLDGASGGGAYELEFLVSGDSFVTQPGPLTELVADAVESVTGRRPDYSTTGGTSDARFIKDLCPVVEFGLVGQSMHKVDEYTTVDDLERLTDIYGVILRDVFDRIG